MSDSSDAPWYADGVKFRCTQCGNCCTGSPGAVWVTDEEIERIAEVLGKPAGEVRLFHTRPLRMKLSLREFANGDCTFFDAKTRRCTVYDARPAQCRTWPMWKSNLADRSAWEETARGCPGIGQGDFVPLEQIEQQLAESPL
ncbi:YkgJ family cysteine cluster protein [Stratiformator vulcanicus]|nr:YkgJ family cysteine cluster protein [Stratiformator vulcanicus]